MSGRRLIAIVALIAVLGVSGCGSKSDSTTTSSSGSPTAAQSGTPNGTKGKPTTPLEQLLPTAADFPPGAQITPMNSSAATDTWDKAKTSIYTPPECSAKVVAAGDVEKKLLDSPKVVAISRQPITSYLVAIGDFPLDLTPARELLDSCPNVHVQADVGGQKVEADSKYQPTDLPADLPPNDAAMAYTVDVTSPAQGAAAAMQAIRGYAILRGVTVVLYVGGLGGAAPDRAVFDQLFVKTAKKVADAP
jgi:hypothetical protein